MAYPYRHDKETRVLSEGFGDPAARTVAGWKAMGGYQGIARALEIGRESTIEEVKASGLRGRG
ncbi:MAG: NADH-quinone oxidoreductase subunit F, partial [Gemmatimonadetes bacterium]|nr:NADH-quinone oxidoreductase subunit F [Gemmatimonadota bacterium]